MATAVARGHTEHKEEQARAFAALSRGELVRLLAEVDTGKLDPNDLEAALALYEKKRWLRRLFATVIGRR